MHPLTEILPDYALARADEIDAKIKFMRDQNSGDFAKTEAEVTAKIGLLAGVPYVAKDNFLTSAEGSHTTASAKILANFKSPIDATAVEKLNNAGAILIGKSNLDAFAHGGSTENSAFGPTKNAYDDARVAGGSSGGSAVIVAKKVVPFALGSDTGGSIREPASFNNVIGLKPTYGLISRYGVIAMASSTDVIGTFTRTAADADLLMGILSGRDGRDGTLLSDSYDNSFHELSDDQKNPNKLREIKRDVVGALIVSADDKVLLGENRKGGVYENLLIVPGGGVEVGESKLDALKREVAEEVGIDISSAQISPLGRTFIMSAEKTLRTNGERVWANMIATDYVVQFSQNADEITRETHETEFGAAKWYSRAELAKQKFNVTTEEFLREAGFLPPKPLKIGVIKEFLGEGIDPEVRDNTEKFAQKLRDQGHAVDEVSLPMSKYALAIYYIVVPAELSSNLARFDGVRYGQRAGADDKFAKIDNQTRFATSDSQMMTENDKTSAQSPDEMFTNSRSTGFMPENKRRLMIGAFVLSSGYFDAYYLKAQQARTLLINEFNKLFADYDFLIGPVAPTPAFKLGENVSDPLKMYLSDVMTTPASMAGLPAVSLPNGFSKSGLPIGIQIIGPQKSDAKILDLAKALENK
ncbi:MAG: amidase family protein [Candidatus Nanoperiomorbaceae bacterium]